MLENSIANRIASEIAANEQQVIAAVELIDEGATIPFIARYRKEKTGGLDDSQLRILETRLIYLRELEERRAVILKSITEQEKLTPDLEQAILQADSKQRLEDLYLPYKPKRRNKAVVAAEAGLTPLADALLNDPTLDPEQHASQFINTEKDINDSKQALEGARYILMERFAEQADLVSALRDFMWKNAHIISKVVEGQQTHGQKFKDYFAYQEPVCKIPSHRTLALFRGRKEGVLSFSLDVTQHETVTIHPAETKIAAFFAIKNLNRPADEWLAGCIRWTWKIKLLPKLELEILTTIRENAEQDAIIVFAHNLKDLLLAAPAGHKITMGLDPGLRTGVKLAIVDITGKLLHTDTLYPHAPQNKWAQAIAMLALLCERFQVQLISIGNGTASRETDKLVQELIQQKPELKLQKIVVSEAGASVYSASELAANEFPGLDVSLRGAVSIARRLQDPLAELVKIEPKSIGVGQYQHDVSQVKLAKSLAAVIEDCVNAVGVHINSASEQLLAHVSGLNSRIAHNIVKYRDQHGAFSSREELKNVSNIGDKVYQQAAGFLRITNGSNPLDASAVHPESYPIVQKIIEKHQSTLDQIMGNKSLLQKLQAQDFVNEQFGLPTIKDIFNELEKPGRDPRPEFITAQFRSDVHEISDLKDNMILEGVVTNVANFGVFVDIGVHQDGMVHISQMSHQFVKDPRSIVKTGDIVKVKVMEVDQERKRIALSMRLDDVAQKNAEATEKLKTTARPAKKEKPPATSLAAAFKNARQLRSSSEP